MATRARSSFRAANVLAETGRRSPQRRLGVHASVQDCRNRGEQETAGSVLGAAIGSVGEVFDRGRQLLAPYAGTGGAALECRGIG